VIGRLRGALVEKQPPHLVLDVNGVGYEIEVPMTTLYRLPHLGETVTLHTHLVVREDAHLLFGFYEKRDREMFRELIRLNGVGPKLALALMSTLEVDELVRCVQAQDTSALTRVPGVGKKTAERSAGRTQGPLQGLGRVCRAHFALVSEGPGAPDGRSRPPSRTRSARWSRWVTSRRKPARRLRPSKTRI
jgi:Holliday junction DNA helicase RuvA